MQEETYKWAMNFVWENGGKLMKTVLSNIVLLKHYKPLLTIYEDRMSVKAETNTGGHR